MAIVLNVKTSGYPVGVEYIGRPNGKQAGSVLANEAHIGKDGTRDEVVAKYRKWLWKKIKEGGEELEELQRLDRKSLRLVCWCAPQACHGDVILKALEWLDTQA